MKKIIKNIIVIIVVLSCLNASSLVRSMAFPGWGEHKEYKINSKEYIKKRSNVFMLLECGILFSYIATSSLSDSHEEDYENYGTLYAGINWAGKDDAYTTNVAKFNSMDSYNEYKISIGQINDTYTNQSYYWNWESTSRRQSYSNMRDKSEKLSDLASIMVAGLIINRIASFFDVINIKKKEGSLFNLSIDQDKKNTNFNFNFNF